MHPPWEQRLPAIQQSIGQSEAIIVALQEETTELRAIDTPTILAEPVGDVPNKGATFIIQSSEVTELEQGSSSPGERTIHWRTNRGAASAAERTLQCRCPATREESSALLLNLINEKIAQTPFAGHCSGGLKALPSAHPGYPAHSRQVLNQLGNKPNLGDQRRLKDLSPSTWKNYCQRYWPCVS